VRVVRSYPTRKASEYAAAFLPFYTKLCRNCQECDKRSSFSLKPVNYRQKRFIAADANSWNKILTVISKCAKELAPNFWPEKLFLAGKTSYQTFQVQRGRQSSRKAA
jgi:hypothetical protein